MTTQQQKQFEHPHDLEEVRMRAEEAFAFYRDNDKTHADPTFDWRPESPNTADITLKINGTLLRGTLTVTGATSSAAGSIVLALDVPDSMRIFAPVALTMIQSEVQKWLK